MRPQVSVVIPTRGRRDSLRAVLDALARQVASPDAFEVVVVCDGDVDGTVAMCQARAPGLPFTLSVGEQVNQGPAAARNWGAAEARAPLLLFLDDDVVPDEGLIDAHLAAQDGHERRVSVGPLLPPSGYGLSLWCAWEERTICFHYDRMVRGEVRPSYRQFYTGNACLRKESFLEAGGFDDSFKRFEDVELGLRLELGGHHFVFLPHARGWHYVARSFDSWVRIPEAYGKAEVRMARAHAPSALDHMAASYRNRHPAVRLAVRACLGRNTIRGISTRVLSAAIKTLDRYRPSQRADIACSLLFNVLFFDSVARELGGRVPFFTVIDGDANSAPIASTKESGTSTGA